MSVRDRATSVHYHPWRSDPLSYVIDDVRYEVGLNKEYFGLSEGRPIVIDNVRYEMVPPPVEYAAGIVEEAQLAFTPLPGSVARLFGRRRAACGTFTLVVGGNPVLWDAVVWSNGERSGVELFRVTPLEPREEA